MPDGQRDCSTEGQEGKDKRDKRALPNCYRVATQGSKTKGWCRGRDLNPHGLIAHWLLRPARLPSSATAAKALLILEVVHPIVKQGRAFGKSCREHAVNNYRSLQRTLP